MVEIGLRILQLWSCIRGLEHTKRRLAGDVPDLPLPTLAVDGATGAFEQQLQALVLNDRQTLVQSIQTDTA